MQHVAHDLFIENAQLKGDPTREGFVELISMLAMAFFRE